MNSYGYFQSYADMPWKWAEEDSVLVDMDGNTIAYKQQLVPILETLKTTGLPRFSSVVLMLALTGPRGESFYEKFFTSTFLRKYQKEIYKLQFITQLPLELRKGTTRIQVICRLLSQSHRHLGIKESLGICDRFEFSPSKNEETPIHYGLERSSLDEMLDPLKHLFNKIYTYEDLIKYLTELPELAVSEVAVLEPIISVANQEESGDLIIELSKTPQTKLIADLIKPIQAALSIPMHVSNRGELPLGGVSDITNHGNFDKLLVSEFAYDDLLFLTRLANNEALYYHREKPESKTKKKRHILIDTGVYNWGQPRITALALAISMQEHPKSSYDTSVFGLNQKSYPMKLGKVSEVLEALNEVHLSIHPSEGLEHYFEHNYEGSETEVIFIGTHVKKYWLPNFERLHYGIAIESLRKMEVFKLSRAGRKSLQIIEIPEPKNTISSSTDSNFLEYRFPLLMHAHFTPKFTLGDEKGTFIVITKSQSVVEFYGSEGKPISNLFRVIFPKLPGTITSASIRKNILNELELLYTSPKHKYLYLVNLTTGKIQHEEHPALFGDHEPKAMTVNGEFHIWYRYRCYRLNWPNIELMQQMNTPKNECISYGTDPLKRPSKSVLKNVNQIGLTKYNEFCFNRFNLSLSGSEVRLERKDATIMATARKIRENQFLFEGGVMFQSHHDGIGILSMEDHSLAPVYINMSIDTVTTISAGGEYCGAGKFVPKTLYNISFETENKDEAKHIISQHLQPQNSQVFENDHQITIFRISVGLCKTFRLITKFSGKNFEEQIYFYNAPNIIRNDDFQKKYLQPYINIIKRATGI